MSFNVTIVIILKMSVSEKSVDKNKRKREVRNVEDYKVNRIKKAWICGSEYTNYKGTTSKQASKKNRDTMFVSWYRPIII